MTKQEIVTILRNLYEGTWGEFCQGNNTCELYFRYKDNKCDPITVRIMSDGQVTGIMYYLTHEVNDIKSCSLTQLAPLLTRPRALN